MYATWPGRPSNTGSDSSGYPASMHARHARLSRCSESSDRYDDRLVDLPARAVVEDALLPALLRVSLARAASDDDERRRDAPRLGEEPRALRLFEVAVEVAREDAIEARVRERQRERVADDEARAWDAFPRNRDHRIALVEPGH